MRIEDRSDRVDHGGGRIGSRNALLMKLFNLGLFGGMRRRFAIRDWHGLDELPVAAELVKAQRFYRLVSPERADAPTGRILVIAPHSDDEAIGPGGTLLLAAAKGATLSTLVVTDGEGASAPVRRAESTAAAARFGAEISFLGRRDGAIDLDEATIAAFAAAIKTAAPDVLMLPFVLDDHDDHRRVGELLLRAAPRLSVKPEIWSYQVYGGVLGNVVVDITDVAEKKADLVRLFASQMATRDWAHFALGLAAWNSRFLPRRDAGSAEMFHVLPFVDWVEEAERFFASKVVYRNGAYRAG